MTRDGLPRAYLRIDPNLDHTHPDPGLYVRLLCAAARQPDRGRFKDRVLLDRALGKAGARKLIDRGDVVTLPDGRAYVDGWDEWQEGDLTVADRRRRMRERRKSKRNGVTPPSSPPSNDVTTDAGTTTYNGSTEASAVGVETPPPPTRGGRRANGTNPRALAEKEREAERERARRNRVQATRERTAQLRAALVARYGE